MAAACRRHPRSAAAAAAAALPLAALALLAAGPRPPPRALSPTTPAPVQQALAALVAAVGSAPAPGGGGGGAYAAGGGAARRTAVERAAAALENALPRPVSWKRGDLALLDGDWDLLFTSSPAGAGSALLDLLPAAGLSLDAWPAPAAGAAEALRRALRPLAVRQEIDVAAGRLSDVVALAPWPRGLQAPGPLGDVLRQLDGAAVTLSLDHRLEAYGFSRLRVVLEGLRRSLGRPDGSSLEGAAAAIPAATAYPVPRGLAELGAGRFDTVFVGQGHRVSRGAAPGRELRVFRRRGAPLAGGQPRESGVPAG